jgi:hypothetical protein
MLNTQPEAPPSACLSPITVPAQGRGSVSPTRGVIDLGLLVGSGPGLLILTGPEVAESGRS